MSKADELRERAEEELKKAKEKGHMPANVSELMHELKVHQIELQIQNEELRKSQEEVSSLYNQYYELYDYAPVGYFTLDKDGIIRNVNIKGAELLQLNKKKVIGRGFSRFISKDGDKYYCALANAIDTDKIQSVELQLKGNTTFYANMEIMIVHKPEEMYRITITDITKRKKAEKELRQSRDNLEAQIQERTKELSFERQRLFDVLETLPAIIALLTPDYRVVFANRAFRERFGESQGRHCYEYIFGCDKPCEWCEIYRVLETGKPHFWEFTAPDGSVIDAYDFPFTDVDGSHLILEMDIDITEQRHAEEKLRESEEKFSKAFYSNPAAMVLASLDGIIIELNDAYANLTGYNRDELIGRKNTDFNILTLKQREELFKKLCDGPIYNEEVEIRTKNGEKRIVLYQIEIMEFGGEKRIFSIGYDVTERKKAAEALQDSEEKYRSIVETANEGIMMADVKGMITFANAKMAEMLGYSIDELVGRYGSSLVDQTELEKSHERVKNRRFGIKEEYELKMCRKDGGELWTHVNGTPIYDQNRVHISNLAMYTNITDRKKAEKELTETVEELKRSNAELQQFAYVSSHDLQEPLRTIASFTQLLERRYKGKLDPDADEFIEYIVDATLRMKQQILDLLEFSRVATNKEEFKLVDTNEVLNQTLGNLHDSIKESKAEITFDELPNVMGNAWQLQRVFQNIISNAIKFKKYEEPLKIHVSAYEDEGTNEYIFSINDNGIGIEKQYFERIFTIFQRLHTMEEYHGTGIGLSIVKKIIERHGGSIWVESEAGVGSTFYFALPIK